MKIRGLFKIIFLSLLSSFVFFAGCGGSSLQSSDEGGITSSDITPAVGTVTGNPSIPSKTLIFSSVLNPPETTGTTDKFAAHCVPSMTGVSGFFCPVTPKFFTMGVRAINLVDCGDVPCNSDQVSTVKTLEIFHTDPTKAPKEMVVTNGLVVFDEPLNLPSISFAVGGIQFVIDYMNYRIGDTTYQICTSDNCGSPLAEMGDVLVLDKISGNYNFYPASALRDSSYSFINSSIANGTAHNLNSPVSPNPEFTTGYAPIFAFQQIAIFPVPEGQEYDVVFNLTHIVSYTTVEAGPYNMSEDGVFTAKIPHSYVGIHSN